MWRLPPFRGLVMLVAGEGASRALSFVAIALLTRRLGVSAWAPVAVALTVVQFGALFVEAGMRLFGAREVARDAAAATRLVRPIVSTQLVMAGAFVVFTTLAAATAILDPALGELLPGYAASLLALPLYVPWIFQGRGEMEWVAGPQVVRFAVFLALSALVVGSPSDVGRLPWIECASMVAGAVVASVAVR
jgi:O-antigen/teichoic acid export membrane protein